MPRGVRKVTLYICTLNGKAFTTAADAKAEAARLRAASIERERTAQRAGHRARARGAQTLHILELLAKGARRPAELRKALHKKVPPANIAPTLNRLKSQGLVHGKDGTYSVTAKGRARLESDE